MTIRNGLIAGALVMSFLVGFFAADNELGLDRKHDPAIARTFTLPLAAQRLWFPPMEDYSNRDVPFKDDKYQALLTILQERLAADETLSDFEREAPIYLQGFVRRIAVPHLTREQVDRALHHLTVLGERHPEHRNLLEEQSRKVELYGLGTGAVPRFSAAFRSWFPATSPYLGESQHFDDARITELLRILEELLSMPETALDFEREARAHLYEFASVLQRGYLTDRQIARIGAFLIEVSARHPDADDLIGREWNRIETLTPGRVAPNITGPDLRGVEFELRDYRGDIVVLYFTGHWCGPCQLEYPYQRLILDLFKDEPVTLLAVNSDSAPSIAYSLNEEKGLHYRSWWDGDGPSQINGPLAQAWGIPGWPHTYILDDGGIVRYIGKRKLEVITAVQDLLTEMGKRKGQEARLGT